MPMLSNFAKANTKKMPAGLPNPKVFISYSHDSDDHKDWVRSIAGRLRNDGVDVVLDQWEIEPGDDVTAFMERSLSSCDRVVIVCTGEYIRKASTLVSGVGYERMIITAEIAGDLGTKKFIPVLRDEKSDTLPAFLGARIYVDFRANEADELEYERLLRSLLGMPKHLKPPLGSSPYHQNENGMPSSRASLTDNKPVQVNLVANGVNSSRKAQVESKKWAYHWHRAVHEYCGTRLHLILLKFAKASIFFKDSILSDIKSSGISDYMIFHLYSHHDLLIRVWADTSSIEALRLKLSKNDDVDHENQPEIIVVDGLAHLTDEGIYPTADQVYEFLNGTPLSILKDIQDNGEGSQHFERFKSAGLILDDKVRFHPDRIQFYVTIRSLQSMDDATFDRLLMQVQGWGGILNRSVYKTSGSSIEAVVKGQADASQYYNICSFLRAITQQLRMNATTETMLVAQCDSNESTHINVRKAEAHIINREFRDLNLDETSLAIEDQLKLKFLYVSARDVLAEDNHDVIMKLIRARADNSPRDIASTLSILFPPFEEKMKKSLPAIIVKEYGSDWHAAIDELKKKEKLEVKTDVRSFVFGDLCKIYKRIVLEKKIIDISPLTEEEFSGVMDAAPVKRNRFAHEGAVLEQWDEIFSFCTKFIPIRYRMLNYIESIGLKN